MFVEIARNLGVAHILEGTVQQVGDRVHVSAQLIDARTDTHVWAERYNRSLVEVFGIENELAEQIVSALKSKLSATEKAAIEENPRRTSTLTISMSAQKFSSKMPCLMNPRREDFSKPLDCSNKP